MSVTHEAPRVPVWDPLVRIGHWALVAAFATAWLSGEEEAGGPDAIHVWSGYAVALILAVRIVWGFVGPRYARFSDFVYSPVVVLRELVATLRGAAPRYLGHSPAGGTMIVALLVCLVATAGTGLAAYGQQGKGPLAPIMPAISQSAEAAPTADAGEHEGGKQESLIGELHGTLANVTLGLVVLHILGVAIASFSHRENLVRAMVTGRKRAAD